MKSKIFIEAGKQLTLTEYISIASRTMSLIGEAAKDIKEIDATFSVNDLVVLLNKICVHMAGEFEVRQTPSRYIHIVYAPDVLDEVGFDEGFMVSNFVDAQDRGQNPLWINEKVVFAFIDRKLYGVATMIYFYLGYLMTQDETFGLSHNISFEKILEGCSQLPKDFPVKHPTTLMRALADLQDAGLIRWNAKSHTFELLHITPYDPNKKV